MKFLFLYVILTANLWAFGPTEKVSKESYEIFIDKAQKIYGPYVALNGGILQIEKNWETAEKASYSSHERPPFYRIVLSGGAFRTPWMTNDGLAFTICHELGHILGGEPKYSPDFWGSVEGQADYSAANTCLKEFFAGEDNTAVVAKLVVPREVREACEKFYAQNEEAALCQRITMAGFVFVENWRQFKLQPGEFQKIYPPLSFVKRDSSIVKVTNRSYPTPQCRFDSVFAGALCTRGKHLTIESWKNPNAIVCDERDPSVTRRPRCWYAH